MGRPFQNGMTRNAVLLINAKAERVGRVNYRAVTFDMTTLVYDMQINMYILAFLNNIHFNTTTD